MAGFGSQKATRAAATSPPVTPNASSDTTAGSHKRMISEGSYDPAPETKKPYATSSSDGYVPAKLDSLQNGNMRSLLDVIDKLRSVGLNDVLSLPALVVCGDQSSGKSSVLEAITQIPFPRNAMLCTRFATEIILRREAKRSITASIVFSDGRAPIRSTTTDFSKLPEFIREAKEHIEHDTFGSDSVPGSGNAPGLKAFFSEMLSITVSGPDMPPLSLVDLPGLIHSETQTHSKNDVDFINVLISKYISNPRSIILAVVSAKHDYANQVILQKARTVDPKGARTLGIITKPDCLEEDSAEEESWISLAQNKDINFELGWHMLRNRAQNETLSSFDERDSMEKEFFAGRAVYRTMDKNTLGIGPLRERLSRLLFAHLKNEIPKLNKELEEELDKTSKLLAALGDQRGTVWDTRTFLMKSSMKYNALLTDALSGNYNDDFFRSTPSISRKLRANIQTNNSYFAKVMLVFGAKYKFKDVPSEILDIIGKEKDIRLDENAKSVIYAKGLQKVKTRSQAVGWVCAKMKTSRGEELPGSVNATLLKELYWEQTANWEALTLTYVATMVNHIREFLEALIQYVMPADVAERVLKLKILPSLACQKDNAIAELGRMINDNSRAPMTYNHYYTDTIQKLRHQKLMTKVKRIVNSMGPTTIGPGNGNGTAFFLNTLDQELVEPDMDKFTAEEALDCLMALYKDKLKNYVAAVTETVIERHLIAPLRDSPISPVALARLSDDEVRVLAGEPEHVRNERSRLSAMKSSLEVGKEAFQSALLQFD